MTAVRTTPPPRHPTALQHQTVPSAAFGDNTPPPTHTPLAPAGALAPVARDVTFTASGGHLNVVTRGGNGRREGDGDVNYRYVFHLSGVLDGATNCRCRRSAGASGVYGLHVWPVACCLLSILCSPNVSF